MSAQSVRRFSACLVSTVLLFGCGGAKSGGGGDSSPDGGGAGGANTPDGGSGGTRDAAGPVNTLDDYAAAYGDALCSFLERCSADYVHVDADSCRAYQTAVALNGTVAGIRDAVAAGTWTFDVQAAQACVDRLRSGVCDVIESDPCYALVHGLVPLGGACKQNIDCAEGSCGAGSGTPCPSTCVPFVETAGADCTQAGCDPAKGLGCNAVSHVCEAPVPNAAVGQPCGFDLQSGGAISCATGLYCTGFDVTTGVCAEPVAAGSPCTTGQLCADGQTCVGKAPDAVCRDLSKIGEPCTSPGANEYFATGCLTGLACDAGKCAAPPATGACAADPFFKCAAGMYCQTATTTCQPLVENGAACDEATACYTLSCNDGTCGQWPACAPQ